MTRVLSLAYSIYLLFGFFTFAWICDSGFQEATIKEIAKLLSIHVVGIIFGIITYYYLKSSESFYKNESRGTIPVKYLCLGFIFAYLLGFVCFFFVNKGI